LQDIPKYVLNGAVQSKQINGLYRMSLYTIPNAKLD
jgi:hypothetical protein